MHLEKNFTSQFCKRLFTLSKLHTTELPYMFKYACLLVYASSSNQIAFGLHLNRTVYSIINTHRCTDNNNYKQSIYSLETPTCCLAPSSARAALVLIGSHFAKKACESSFTVSGLQNRNTKPETGNPITIVKEQKRVLTINQAMEIFAKSSR